jgi:hypothetical protein
MHSRGENRLQVSGSRLQVEKIGCRFQVAGCRLKNKKLKAARSIGMPTTNQKCRLADF